MFKSKLLEPRLSFVFKQATVSNLIISNTEVRSSRFRYTCQKDGLIGNSRRAEIDLQLTCNPNQASMTTVGREGDC